MRGEPTTPASRLARPVTRSATAALALLLVATGCRSVGVVRTKALQDNQDLAAANNQLLLLNIVRAKERHPMFFTAPGAPTDVISASASLAPTIPFGGGSSDAYGVGASATAGGSRTMTASALESDEFWKGITRPIATTTLAYLWNQGWQRELLLHLTVLRMIVTQTRRDTKGTEQPDDDTCTTCTSVYYNYLSGPNDRGRYLEFLSQIAQLLNRGADLTTEPDTKWVGPAFERSEVTIEQIAEAKAQGYDLLPYSEPVEAAQSTASPPPDQPGATPPLEEKPKAKTAKYWRLAKPSERWVFTFRKAACETKPVARPAGSGAPANATTTTDSAASGGKAAVSTQDARSPLPADGKCDIGDSYELVLRSPEAILYYLGEIVRAYEDPDRFEARIGLRNPDGTSRGKEAVLFALRKCERGDCCAGLGVNYCGQQYGIPCDDEEAGRSTQVLSLIAQLFAQHKLSKDLPQTNVVQLIGR
jgi:hypothetical protein